MSRASADLEKEDLIWINGPNDGLEAEIFSVQHPDRTSPQWHHQRSDHCRKFPGRV